MKKRDKYQNIIEDAFDFLKETCVYCGKRIKNKIFCSEKCKILYFNKQHKKKIGKYVPKKKQNKQHVNVSSNILSEEYLKQMVEKTEKDIDVRMNKLKR